MQLPQGRQGETEGDDALRKFWRGKELADGKEVRDASNSERNENDGSPMRLKLREQIVSATSNMAPSPYSLCEDESFTGLQFNDEVARLFAAIR